MKIIKILFLLILPFLTQGQIKKHPPRSVTYSAGSSPSATWNPSDKSASVTLSSGNTATSTSATANVRGTIGTSSRKVYWETVSTLNTFQGTGFGNSSAALDAVIVGGTNDSWGLWDDGNVYHNGSTTFFGNPSLGDVVGFALDMTAGTCDIYRNNSLLGTITGITGTIYPMWGANFGLATNQAHFTTASFTYTPPSGYSEW